MSKEDLRSVSYPNCGSPGKFHVWVIKEEVTKATNDRTQTNQYAVALVEEAGGGMKEVPSQLIHFLN